MMTFCGFIENQEPIYNRLWRLAATCVFRSVCTFNSATSCCICLSQRVPLIHMRNDRATVRHDSYVLLGPEKIPLFLFLLLLISDSATKKEPERRPELPAFYSCFVLYAYTSLYCHDI